MRARSVFPSSNDDDDELDAEIVPKASSERSWKTKGSLNVSSKFLFSFRFLYRLQQKYVRYKRRRCARGSARSNDDENGDAEIVPKVSSERSWKTKIARRF